MSATASKSNYSDLNDRKNALAQSIPMKQRKRAGQFMYSFTMHQRQSYAHTDDPKKTSLWRSPSYWDTRNERKISRPTLVFADDASRCTKEQCYVTIHPCETHERTGKRNNVCEYPSTMLKEAAKHQKYQPCIRRRRTMSRRTGNSLLSYAIHPRGTQGRKERTDDILQHAPTTVDDPSRLQRPQKDFLPTQSDPVEHREQAKLLTTCLRI